MTSWRRFSFSLCVDAFGNFSLFERFIPFPFLFQAQMADQEFIAEKQNIQILDKTSFTLMEKNILSASEKHVEDLMHHLSVPRRPQWNR
jgi:hypothetical protein